MRGASFDDMFVKFGTYIACYMIYLILGGDNSENNFQKYQIQDGGPIGGHFGFWQAKIHFWLSHHLSLD